MEVSIVMGVSIVMLVFVNGKIPPFEMDDDWGYPYFRKPPYYGDISWNIMVTYWEIMVIYSDIMVVIILGHDGDIFGYHGGNYVGT